MWVILILMIVVTLLVVMTPQVKDSIVEVLPNSGFIQDWDLRPLNRDFQRVAKVGDNLLPDLDEETEPYKQSEISMVMNHTMRRLNNNGPDEFYINDIEKVEKRSLNGVTRYDVSFVAANRKRYMTVVMNLVASIVDGSVNIESLYLSNPVPESNHFQQGGGMTFMKAEFGAHAAGVGDTGDQGLRPYEFVLQEPTVPVGPTTLKGGGGL